MRYFLSFLLLVVSLLSCSDDDPVFNPSIDPGSSGTNSNGIDLTTQLVDVFTVYSLERYYFWIDDPNRVDLVNEVFNPDTCRHPKAALSRVLSKEDRWTTLFDNMTESTESMAGTTLSTGLQVKPYLQDQSSQRVFFVVLYVHPGSPAAEAGFKRGDIINKIDGNYITTSNYLRFYSLNASTKLGLAQIYDNGYIEDTDRSVTLTPVKDYFEPVIKTKVFDIDGTKKVGYMNYAKFTDTDKSLIEAMDYFKDEGISELILDLRYNGGGYDISLFALASMMVPKKNVEQEDVFLTNIYNNLLTEYYKKRQLDLDDKFNKKYIDHNPDLKKVYFLVSKQSASASEAIIVGLSPYMDVTIIGETTHGKFCTGALLTPENVLPDEFYLKYQKDFKDWGLYVMTSTFADKNGYNGSRPNGFTPNTIIEDNPFDGYDIGDPNETMLCEALEQAGLKIPTSYAPTRSAQPYKVFKELEVDSPSYFIRKGHVFK